MWWGTQTGFLNSYISILVWLPYLGCQDNAAPWRPLQHGKCDIPGLRQTPPDQTNAPERLLNPLPFASVTLLTFHFLYSLLTFLSSISDDNTLKDALSAYYVPDTVLRASHILWISLSSQLEEIGTVMIPILCMKKKSRRLSNSFKSHSCWVSDSELKLRSSWL